MRIIIVGCGKVGSSIASELNLEGHEISVVDINHGAVDKLANSLDVLGIEGNGATYDVLIEAGAEYADLLIAATARDEINLYSCLMAKAAGVTHTIARVRNPEYTNDLYRIKEHLGLSMAINPEQTAANEISRLLRFSGALEIDSFSKGVVELIKVTVPQNSSIVGTALSRVDNLRGKVRICTVERGDEMFIPNGDFVINGGDRISVVAKPEIAAKFFKRISIAIGRSKDVILLGGGKVSFYLAKTLIKSGANVKIIEKNPERCNFLSEAMPEAVIIQGDCSILHTDCIKFFQDRLAMVTERYLFLEKLYPDMLENDAYFVDMALNDYPILYRSALDPESDQLIRHAYQKSRSILSFYNKMRFAFFSRSKALYYFIERRNRNLARYDNC